MHKCHIVKRKYSQRGVPSIAVGAKAYALCMERRACAVDYITTTLVEVIVKQQCIVCLCRLNIAYMLVAILCYLCFTESRTPNAYLIYLTFESVRIDAMVIVSRRGKVVVNFVEAVPKCTASR